MQRALHTSELNTLASSLRFVYLHNNQPACREQNPSKKISYADLRKTITGSRVEQLSSFDGFTFGVALGTQVEYCEGKRAGRDRGSLICQHYRVHDEMYYSSRVEIVLNKCMCSRYSLGYST